MTFTHKNVLKFYTAYEINLWPLNLDSIFMLKNSLFGAVKLTKSANSDKYSYSGYRMGFDTFVFFSLSDSGIGKIVIIFDVDISSSVHNDNKKKKFLK